MKSDVVGRIILLLFGTGILSIIYGGYLLSYQMTFSIPAYALFLLIGVILVSIAFYMKGKA